MSALFLPFFDDRWDGPSITLITGTSVPAAIGFSGRAGRVSQTRQHDPGDLRTHLCLNHSLNGSCCQLARHGVVRVLALLARKATVEIGWPHNGHCQAKALGRQNRYATFE